MRTGSFQGSLRHGAAARSRVTDGGGAGSLHARKSAGGRETGVALHPAHRAAGVALRELPWVLHSTVRRAKESQAVLPGLEPGHRGPARTPQVGEEGAASRP